MTTSDRVRWDERYRMVATPDFIAPPQLVRDELATIDPPGCALDVASGIGDSGLYLASLGCQVTLTDVSAVALQIASDRASRLQLEVRTAVIDLDDDPIPSGPWDIITCVHFLDRALLTRLGRRLSPTGRLLIAVATTINLERHERPSARFLLAPNELPSLVPELDVIRHDEEWRNNGVHEAWLVAAPT